MIKKRLIGLIVIAISIFYGCVKDLHDLGISEATVFKGRVLEESEREPLANIDVIITNDSTDYESTKTNNEGRFELTVSINKLDGEPYLFLDAGSFGITKKTRLRGIGRESYDYGDIFLYNKNDVVVPTVITNPISNISSNSVQCGGNVTSDGGITVTERGVCWAKATTTHSPTISNHFKKDTGAGMGSFSCTITDLSENTDYYVCAYAKNAAGISYGIPIQFKTLSGGGGESIGSEFVEDFESGIPSNWVIIDADGDGYTWVSSMIPGAYHNSGVNLTGTGHNSSNAYVISGSWINQPGQALTPDNYLVSPKVTLKAGSIFSFYACAQDASYAAEHFGVAVSDNGTQWMMVREWTMTAKNEGGARSYGRNGNNRDQGNWYLYTVDLSNFSGQKYIAIRHFNCTDQFVLNVDDVELSIGGGGGGQTYTYSFESSVENWHQIDADGDGYTWMRWYSSEGNAGHNSKYLVTSESFVNDVGALYPDNYLYSPIQYLISDGARISFYVCAQDAGWPAEHYGVAVATTNGSPTASDFVTIWMETLSAKVKTEGKVRGITEQGTWYLKTIDLSDYAGQSICIAIRHFDCTDQFRLNIDDITIKTGN